MTDQSDNIKIQNTYTNYTINKMEKDMNRLGKTVCDAHNNKELVSGVSRMLTNQ